MLGGLHSLRMGIERRGYQGGGVATSILSFGAFDVRGRREPLLLLLPDVLLLLLPARRRRGPVWCFLGCCRQGWRAWSLQRSA